MWEIKIRRQLRYTPADVLVTPERIRMRCDICRKNYLMILEEDMSNKEHKWQVEELHKKVSNCCNIN